MVAIKSDLKEALAHSDKDAVRALLKGTTKEEKETLAPTAIAAYKQALRRLNARHIGSTLGAVLVTATSSQIEKLSLWYLGLHELDLDLLADHKPTTLNAWLDRVLQQSLVDEALIAELVNRNLVQRPDSDAYILCLMRSLKFISMHETVTEYLKSDKEFMEHYVWRLFEVEGNGENSLAAIDKFSPPTSTWEHALLELSREGYISRSRLLDASLEALDRGFQQFRSGWYSRFHEAMQPTIDERCQRVHRYIRLVGSTVPTTISFALNALTKIDKKQPIASADLINNFEPALRAKSKSTAISALSIMGSAIARDANSRSSLCRHAIKALLHEAPDVQQKALDIVSPYVMSDDSLKVEILRCAEFLNPSVRKKFQGLLQPDQMLNQSVDGGENTTKPEPYQRKEECVTDPLSTSMEITPFRTVEELIAACSYCLENPSETSEMERTIAAASAWIDNLPREFATLSAPLKKRAHSLKDSQTFSHTFLQSLYASFVFAWLNGDTHFPIHFYRDSGSQHLIYRLWLARLSQIAERNSLPPFFAATHTGGWIRPQVLAERWKIYQESAKCPSDGEQAIALLRLPLSSLDKTFPEYRDLHGEFWDAVRFAVGILDAPANQSSVLWQAANAYRNPCSPAKALHMAGFRLWIHPHDYDFLRYLGALVPALRNQFVASGVRELGDAIDNFYESSRCVRAYLEVMLDPSFIFDRVAYHALAAGLILSDPACAGVAQDVLISLIDSGRLDVKVLGVEIGGFLYSDRSKIKRLVKTFSEVARLSGRHSNAIRQMCEYSLQGGHHVPRDLSALLELLNELLHAEEAKVTNPATIEHLRSLKMGGKTRQLIRQLLP